MDTKKSHELNGQNNNRINNVDEIHNESTAALANSEIITPDAHISIPSYDSVERAKDWVDNGSRL